MIHLATILFTILALTIPFSVATQANENVIVGSTDTTEPFRCNHDDPDLHALLYSEPPGSDGILSPQIYAATANLQSNNGSDGIIANSAEVASSQRRNIRITVSSLDLDDSTKYCTTPGGSSPNFQGGTATCASDGSDVLTAAKKALLLDTILPRAIQMLSSVLLVDPIQGNLIVRSGCSSFTLGPNDRTTGIPNSDYHLYVSAAPTTSNVVAWAGFCSLDTNNRPVTGRANFSPKYITWSETNVKAQQQLVRTAVHELLHALGFSSYFWTQLFPNRPVIVSDTRRGKPVTVFTSPTVVEKAKEHFGCDSLTGPEIEDDGGGGTAGSHWEQRNHFQDVMAGQVGPDMFLSSVTLALLQDSGVYSIDWTKVEQPTWLAKAGCGAHEDKCNTVRGGYGRFFCDIDQPTQCNAARNAIGSCRTSTYPADLPTWAQYFNGEPKKGGTYTLADYCPITSGFSNFQCDSPTNANANASQSAMYFATDGRCFATSVDVATVGTFSRYSYPARCLQTRCTATTSSVTKLEFRLNDTAPWVHCPNNGDVISLSAYGYKGTLTCPDALSVCWGLVRDPSQITGPGAEPNRPPPLTTFRGHVDMRPSAPVVAILTLRLYMGDLSSSYVSSEGRNPASSDDFIAPSTQTMSDFFKNMTALREVLQNDIQMKLREADGVIVDRVLEQTPRRTVLPFASSSSSSPTSANNDSVIAPSFIVRALISKKESSDFLLRVWAFTLNETYLAANSGNNNGGVTAPPRTTLQKLGWFNQTQEHLTTTTTSSSTTRTLLLWISQENAANTDDASPALASSASASAANNRFFRQCGPGGCIVVVVLASMGVYVGTILLSLLVWWSVLRCHSKENPHISQNEIISTTAPY